MELANSVTYWPKRKQMINMAVAPRTPPLPPKKNMQQKKKPTCGQ